MSWGVLQGSRQAARVAPPRRRRNLGRFGALIVVCATFCAAAGPARAGVDIGPERVVVSAPGAVATIDRAPLRVSFMDGEGRTVLSQVADSGQAPLLVPPHSRPEPLGADRADVPTLYAPFAFMVGAQRSEQHYGGLWQGNQLLGVEGGVLYSARSVLDAQPLGEGARLTLSTSDPSGRKLVVDVVPEGSTLRVTARPFPNDGVVIMSDAFTTAGDEAFRGFGGRHNALDQRGNDFYNWLEEENFPCATAGPPGTLTCATLQDSPEEETLFPNGPTAAYYVQSLFVSSRPYGFMLRRPELSFWRLASDRPDAWQTSVAANELDYTVAPGEAPQAIKSLTDLSGRHRVPQQWTLGNQTTRLVKPGQGLNAEEHEAFIRDDIKQIDKYDFKLDGYDMFGWQLILRRPGGLETVKELLREFHKRGVRVTAYFPPFVEQGASGYTNPADFPDAVGKGLVAKTDTGAPFLFSTPLVAPVGALLDYTNPDTVKWWEGKVREALDLGFDGFMQDFGEQVQTEMRFANGEAGGSMHNKYPLIYHRVTREIFDRYEREHPDRELWFYTRSGYNTVQDLPGSTTFEEANFPGDNNADFGKSNGLASAAPDMLNRAVGGAYGYTTDIGGYAGDTTKDLLIRWAQWASLSPYFRLHNSSSGDTRQPWFFDDETVAIYKRSAELKVRARPLLTELWKEAQRDGLPPTRPLWLQFPGDPEAAKQEQEWMLGPDVLVAPAVTKDAVAREVYFPQGCWESPETGQQVTGPRNVKVEAPLGRLPYFFRCGTNPFAEAAGQRGCLSRRSPIGPRNVGRVRIGYARRQALRRIGPKPVRRTRHAYHWCVKDRRGGRVSAVFGARGRSVLVLTSARAHGNRKLRPRSGVAALRRAYPRRRRVIRGVFRASKRNPRIFVVRRGKVRAFGVADRRLLRSPRKLRAALKRAR